MVGHLLCHFQENCDVLSILAWLRAVPVQPSPTHVGEILALLWLNVSSVTPVFLQHMVAAHTRVCGLTGPKNPLLNAQWPGHHLQP